MRHPSSSHDWAGGYHINFVWEMLNTPPIAATARMYWDSSKACLVVYNGSTWRPLDPAKLTDGSVPISALATNPLDRRNHTATQPASSISDFAATVQTTRLDQFAQPIVDISFGNVRLTNVADPIAAQGVATKNYVDGAVQSAAAGIDSKPSVRLLSTGNITLSGTQTIDSVAAAAGDRVLVIGQTTASQNGVYVVATGSWFRANDADQNGEITPGAFWFVEEGASNARTQWRCNNTGAITIGTTAITIVQFGAADMYSAGANGGLVLSGSAFSVLLPSAAGLQANAAGLSIRLGTNSGLTLSTSGLSVQLAGNSGLILTASGLAVDFSGTNGIVVPRFKTLTLTGDGSTTSFTLTHNMNTIRIVPTFLDNNNAAIDPDWSLPNTNQMTVQIFPALGGGVVYTVNLLAGA